LFAIPVGFSSSSDDGSGSSIGTGPGAGDGGGSITQLVEIIFLDATDIKNKKKSEKPSLAFIFFYNSFTYNKSFKENMSAPKVY